jgi:hypothetical protein
MKLKGGVVVKKILLKDNDCGVVKTNELRKHDLLKSIKHLSLIPIRSLMS